MWGWYDRPVVAAVPSGFSLTPQIIKNMKFSEYSITWLTQRREEKN
jgi:hypothetical protein